MLASTGAWTNWKNWWVRRWPPKVKIWPNWRKPMFSNWPFAICTNCENAKRSDWILRPHLRHHRHRPMDRTNSALDSLTAPPKCRAIWPPPPAWTSQSAKGFCRIWDVASTNWKHSRPPLVPSSSRRPATRRPALRPNNNNKPTAFATCTTTGRPSCRRYRSARPCPTWRNLD